MRNTFTEGEEVEGGGGVRGTGGGDGGQSQEGDHTGILKLTEIHQSNAEKT